jgi:hypothetical protein
MLGVPDSVPQVSTDRDPSQRGQHDEGSFDDQARFRDTRTNHRTTRAQSRMAASGERLVLPLQRHAPLGRRLLGGAPGTSPANGRHRSRTDRCRSSSRPSVVPGSDGEKGDEEEDDSEDDE